MLSSLAIRCVVLASVPEASGVALSSEHDFIEVSGPGKSNYHCFADVPSRTTNFFQPEKTYSFRVDAGATRVDVLSKVPDIDDISNKTLIEDAAPFKIEETRLVSKSLWELIVRLNELRSLEDGWLDGEGEAPPQAGIEWLESFFIANFDNVNLPYLYPTEAGGIQAEWTLGNRELVLDVDLNNKKGYWHEMDMATMEDDDKILTLDSIDDVGWIIGRIGGGAYS